MMFIGGMLCIWVSSLGLLSSLMVEFLFKYDCIVYATGFAIVGAIGYILIDKEMKIGG